MHFEFRSLKYIGHFGRKCVRHRPVLFSRLLLTIAATKLAAINAQPGWGWEAQCIGEWLQCGGQNYWGPTNCCPKTRCEYINDWWWQCNPITPSSTPTSAPLGAPTTSLPNSPTSAPNSPRGTQTPTLTPTFSNPALTPTSAPTFGLGGQPVTPTPTVLPAMPSINVSQTFGTQACLRIRKNVLSLSPDELQTLIEGFQTLKASGIYDNITWIHGNPATFSEFHGNDYFLPWHRWYVYYIETAFRKLGGKYTCFAMPYWDWTLDAGREAFSPVYKFFGPMGNKSDSFCMRTGPWASWTNRKGLSCSSMVPLLPCNSLVIPAAALIGGCLKRIGSDSYRFFSPAEILDLIMTQDKIVNGFRPTFEAGAHSRPHLYLGGAMNTFASPDDPIFWLHHSMVDKVWAMWQDCHNETNPRNITASMFEPEMLDVGLPYAPNITSRMMWSIRDLGYTYETDIMSATVFTGFCQWSDFLPDPAITAQAKAVLDLPTDSDNAKHPMSGQPFASRPSTPNLRGPKDNPASETSAAQKVSEIYGFSLLLEENRVRQDCLKRLAGMDTAAFMRCNKEVLDWDCKSLGYICDLPQTYRDNMNLRQAEALLHEEMQCTRQCPMAEKPAAPEQAP